MAMRVMCDKGSISLRSASSPSSAHSSKARKKVWCPSAASLSLRALKPLVQNFAKSFLCQSGDAVEGRSLFFGEEELVCAEVPSLPV